MEAKLLPCEEGSEVHRECSRRDSVWLTEIWPVVVSVSTARQIYLAVASHKNVSSEDILSSSCALSIDKVTSLASRFGSTMVASREQKISSQFHSNLLILVVVVSHHAPVNVFVVGYGGGLAFSVSFDPGTI